MRRSLRDSSEGFSYGSMRNVERFVPIFPAGLPHVSESLREGESFIDNKRLFENNLSSGVTFQHASCLLSVPNVHSLESSQKLCRKLPSWNERKFKAKRFHKTILISSYPVFTSQP